MKIILKDKNVKAIFINIFGGITRCDDVAQGIMQAREKLGIDIPLVVRLTGTNEEKARESLKGTDIIFASGMDEGVKRAIEAAQGR